MLTYAKLDLISQHDEESSDMILECPFGNSRFDENM